MGHHLRLRSRILAVALSVLGIAACSDARAEPPTSSQTSGSNSAAGVVADPSGSSAGSPSDVTTLAADTGPPGIATSLIDDCVDFVQYGAFIGNSLLTQLWNDSGQNPTYLRTICAAAGTADINSLEGMSLQWADVQRFISVSTTPPSTPASSPTTSAERGENADVSSNSTVPTDAAVASPGFECDRNYTGCVPIATDVDCAGDGDGPAFQSEPVGVVAKDVYGLDPDGNSVGCG
jgi:hypothetical protein